MFKRVVLEFPQFRRNVAEITPASEMGRSRRRPYERVFMRPSAELEGQAQSRGNTAWRCNRRPGKKTREVDDVDAIGQI